jgi:Ca2+-binding RTX toxin-like protein
LTAIGQYESGNNYSFVSSLGYLGRFQFAEEALTDVGFYTPDGSGNMTDFVGGFTPWAAATYGVTDKYSFLESPAAQDDAVQKWFAKIISDATMLGLDKYVGQTIGGIEITTSGLIAGAHLVGVWNLKSFLESNGADVAQDGYGTTVANYLGRFADYDTPFSLGDSSATPSGATGNDTIAGAAGGDHIVTSGTNNLDGDAGANTLYGGTGQDFVRGLDGNDSIDGGAGADDLNGNKGADTVHGGDGADVVRGGQGADMVYGDAGDDVHVNGNLGDDTVHGGDGNDAVFGGQGNDVLFGDAGDDYLSGDLGSDTLTGGAGADTFHLGLNSGHDYVTDFNAAEGDRVLLDHGSSYTVSQSGADTVVTLSTGEQLTLLGVNSSTLPGGWIAVS